MGRGGSQVGALYINVEDVGIIRWDASGTYEETGIPTSATALGYGGDGFHYANGGPLEANSLYRMDVTVPGTVPIFVGSGTRAIEDLDADGSGILYGVGEGWIFTIDPNTGQQTDFAPLGFTSSALAYDETLDLFLVADGTDLLFLELSTMGTTWVRELPGGAVDFGGHSEAPSGLGNPNAKPLSLSYPNPFRSNTTIAFDFPSDTRVHLDVFDVQGRVVGTLLNGSLLRAGPQEVVWPGQDGSGRSLGAGTYYYRLQTDTSFEVGEMTLVR